MKQPKKPQTKKPSKSSSATKLFTEHLSDLKKALTIYFLCLSLLSIVGYSLSDELLNILVKPLGGALYYTSLFGAFEAILGVSIIFGLLVSFPLLLYQIVSFIWPSESMNKSKVFILVGISYVLGLVGLIFSYYVVLPASITFLAKFSSENLQALITSKEYFSLVTKYLLGFWIIFQLPLVMLVANMYLKLKTKQLLKAFKYIVLVSFIVAAILTPTPDPFNQAIMAVPIIALYLLSVLFILIINKKTLPR